jgi:hypothetical protein
MNSELKNRDRNMKHVLLGCGYKWEAKWKGPRRVNMVDVLYTCIKIEQ